MFIPHTSISRFHCIITNEDNKYHLNDLDSKNGTFINDQRITHKILKDGDMIRLGNFIKILFKHKTAGEKPMEVLDDDPKKSDISFISAGDFSESKIINIGAGDRSIDSFERAHKGLKALFRVTNALHISEFEEAVFQEILSSLKNAVSAERLFILDYDTNSREIEIRHFLGDRPGKHVQFSRTILDEMFLRNEVVLSRDCIVDERFSFAGSVIGARIKSVICAPLQWQEEHYGILYLDHRIETDAFTEEDAKLVAVIARQASQTLRRQKLTRDLGELFTSTIRTLVAAIEVKDPYTCGHSERVTKLSLALADAVVVNANQRKNIELSALLHDVGKIGIPESVLHKNGKLDSSEMDVIRNHPSIGYTIVDNIKNAKNISQGVKYHHERFDGKGYPEGLVGSKIPLIARIISIADAFDAMTSTRSYRIALSIESALAEIKVNAGTQFDPDLVKAFVGIVTNWDKDDLEKTSTITNIWLEEYGLTRETASTTTSDDQ